jgi:imidazolonepropionase-like amidohydrolase
MGSSLSTLKDKVPCFGNRRADVSKDVTTTTPEPAPPVGNNGHQVAPPDGANGYATKSKDIVPQVNGISKKIALKNVRVFDGNAFGEPSTIVIDGKVIGNDATGAVEVDGNGGYLLPGFIDAHIHLMGVESLDQLLKYGVTTALDMGCWPAARVNALRNLPGHTDIRSVGAPVTAPGSLHSRFPGLPPDALMTGPEMATDFVAARVAEGSDYIKVIADVPGPSQETLNAVVAAAHSHQKLVIAHASAIKPVEMAEEAGVDVLTHVPLDKAIDADFAARLAAANRICVPTLTMMEGIVNKLKPPGRSYANGRESVTALYKAGVPILAGTDANTQKGVPCSIQHGDSFHHELELLIDAGLSNLDALRACTVLPAKHFGLEDRGVIEPGKRADLVLLSANPLERIGATRKIVKIWLVGEEVTGREQGDDSMKKDLALMAA